MLTLKENKYQIELKDKNLHKRSVNRRIKIALMNRGGKPDQRHWRLMKIQEETNQSIRIDEKREYILKFLLSLIC